jgi:hypothetical protein
MTKRQNAIFFIFFSILDDVPMSIIEDSAQLVKANSISGNKMNDIDVVYTLWSNLKKTEGMVVGQVQIFNCFGQFLENFGHFDIFFDKIWYFWHLLATLPTAFTAKK